MSKDQSLVMLKKLGFNVPNFLIINNLEEYHQKKYLLNKNKKYAIRSSSNCEDSNTFSFAGIFNTYLNISFDNIENCIHKILDFDLCSNLNIYTDYFKIKKNNIKMKVIIQEMINCDISGVAFSKNPVSNQEDKLIEAVWGLGEGLVSGDYTPDQIIVNADKSFIYKTSYQSHKKICSHSEIKEIEVPCIEKSMKKLNSKKILELTNTINELQITQNDPFEIEWGFKKNKLYLFQIRPITRYK